MDQLTAALPAELAVVIPTLNERENVPLLVDRLDQALSGVRWEAIFVDDDSEDGTADAVRRIARRRANIRIVQRLGRRGLSSACIEGMLASAAPYIAVIDGDLQHDENLLPQMLAAIKQGRVDIVVASRFAAGGSTPGLTLARQRLSAWANRLARLIVRAELSDPMSGYFLIERGAFDAAMRNLSGQGFKILLDIFASSPRPLAFAELPYAFRPRRHGESKLDTLVAWEYGLLLLDKLVGHVVPVRFLLFSAIGGLGVFTLMFILWVTTHLLFFPFALGQATATVAGMTGNFFLNNLFTYRDRRLRGWRLLGGLLSFYAVCGIGAVANVGIAAHLFDTSHSWWLSGLAGAAIGAVWNYAMSAVFTWRSGGRGPRRPSVAAAPAASLAETAE
jgi:dolichol-phosphate mannosyltransferase